MLKSHSDGIRNADQPSAAGRHRRGDRRRISRRRLRSSRSSRSRSAKAERRARATRGVDFLNQSPRRSIPVPVWLVAEHEAVRDAPPVGEETRADDREAQGPAWPGPLGGSEGEDGSIHRAGVGAFVIAHALADQHLEGLDMPPELSIPTSLAVEAAASSRHRLPPCRTTTPCLLVGHHSPLPAPSGLESGVES